VILSTHIVSDVEATATEIAIIKQGELLQHALPEEFLQKAEGQVGEWVVASSELPAIKEQYLISSTIRRSDGVHVRIVSQQAPGSGAVAVSPNLEDCYLSLLNGSAKVMEGVLA
jgi:ABC-type multidrug transport system ATPase subunit